MDTRPVIVLCFGRSGSSMTVDCFRRHGLWTGHTEKVNVWGYTTYENELIKTAIKSMYPRPGYPWERDEKAFTPVPAKQEKIMAQLDWPSRPVIKSNVYYWMVWRDLFPECKLVFVKRNPQSESRSIADKRGGDYRSTLSQMIGKHRDLDEYAEEAGSPVILTDEIIAGDFSTLKKAFAYADVEYDQSIIDQVVNKRLWKH